MSVLDEKDRLGQKLRDLEKAREDQWAAEHDRELIEKLRAKIAAEKTHMNCPQCGRALGPVVRSGLPMLQCADHGAWLEKKTLELLSQRSRDKQ